MGMIRMDIETVLVGGGPVASLVVLKPHNPKGLGEVGALPIRIGAVEASAIGMGIDPEKTDRPMTHDLLVSTVSALGAEIKSVSVVRVEGTTFFAQVNLVGSDGSHVSIDARPSDAIALAVRIKAPIFASEEVMTTAACPDFHAVKADEQAHELEEFHDFVESLSPEDFSTTEPQK
ncbi:MAG: bifunctional nuclease family protein [Atopobiaceae bacterium]|nr:bifunctional nuclease family protein [Atopobiaceae bacterium]MCI2173651.1 bifunctional nuclease family protein [Atopobiaceae bacterium]MCI2207707.1 bifunctional nuclease family protein [Atopobiaceae bacterium]